MAFDLKDFEKDVVEASAATPVVIDFWAEWCGPCRQLGPAMEKLAKEANGRWKLVKINTDTNPDIAIQFNVRGIPAVKMVYQKQIVAEFTGAQPEHMIRKWLEENLPDDSGGESEEIISRVNELLGAGDRKQAISLLSGQISEDAPATSKVLYAMLLLPGQLMEAEQWMGTISDREKYEIEFDALDTIKHLKELSEGNTILGDSSSTAGQEYVEGYQALFANDFERALQHFIRSLQINRSVDDDGARKAAIACFTLLTAYHPLTLKYRRQFSMSLY